MDIPSQNPNNFVVVSKETNEYLDRIEMERKRKIDEDQRRWYEMKMKMLGPELMKQEYPSTPKEAFESANEGLYYGMQLSKLRATGSVCRVPYDDALPVHTAWDIGLDDFTAIWCFQVGRGGNISIINYYENWDEGAAHYCDWLNKKKYRFGRHIFPHDARKRDLGSKTQYLDYVTPLLEGRFVVLDIKECDKLEGIQTVRSMLSRCVFDEEKTGQGFKHLEAYKKVWDDRLGCYKNTPLHDEHSHACFIGETQIETSEGQKAIKNIQIGDVVKTPNGYKSVVNKFIKYVDKLVFIRYGNFFVYCTPQHEFFTKKGLKYADTLKYNDIPYTVEDIGECQRKFGSKSCKQGIGFKENFLSQKMGSPFTTTDINIDGMEIIIEHLLLRLVHFQRYIEQFGQNIMGIFQKAFTYIISTEINKTIALTTCISSPVPNILYCIPKKKKENLFLENPLESLCSTQRNGIPANKEKSGIENMLKKWDLVKMNCQCFADIAGKNFWEKFTIRNYVQMPVKQKSDINLALIMRTAFAKCVESLSRLINMRSKKHVVKSVPLNLQEPQEVYDLEIENDHCYYANGFLVSNSDAFRYLAVGLKAIERRDDRGPDDDIKAVNRYYGL